MHKVYIFCIDAPMNILDNEFVSFYEPATMPNSIQMKNGRYYGLYAWTTNKKIKKCFKAERKMEYFISETLYLDDEEFKEFVEENDTCKLKDRTLETFAILGKKIVKGMELLALTEFEFDTVSDTWTAQTTAFYFVDMAFEGTMSASDVYKTTSIISKKYYNNIWLLRYLYELSRAMHIDDDSVSSCSDYFYFEYEELNVLKVFMLIFGPLFKTSNKGDILDEII